MPANPEVAEYIKRAAIARGISPEIAIRVASSEALNVFDPNRPDLGGDDRSSFGPFQLHYGGMSKAMPHGGLGDEFTKATGLRANDPSTWRQQVDFALDTAKHDGWRQWMGAANTGIPRWAGISDKGPAPATTGQADVIDGPKGQEQVQPAGTSSRPQGPVEAAGGGRGSDPVNPSMAPTPQPGDPQVAAAAPVAPPKQKSYWQKFTEGLGNTDFSGSKPVASNITDLPRAALASGQPTSFGASGMGGGDDLKRQQLALVMQRLNSQRLF